MLGRCSAGTCVFSRYVTGTWWTYSSHPAGIQQAHRMYVSDTEQVHSGHSAGAKQALDGDVPEGRPVSCSLWNLLSFPPLCQAPPLSTENVPWGPVLHLGE